jgi:spore germination protein YaaH
VSLVALILAVAVSPAATAASSMSRNSLQAFLLTSSPDSLSDLEAHARSVGVVYPTYFDCRVPSGRIAGRSIPSIASYAKARHIALMPRFNCQDGATVHWILTEPSLRAATLTRLVGIASAPLLRGVCLDLENDGAEDREALSSFVAALAARLHARHRRLAVVVDGVEHEDAQGARISTGFYDDRALSAVADTVFVLAWGTHWEGSAAGPISSLGYVEGVASYVASLPNASRFVLGAPMYGLDWPEQGGKAKAYQYSEVMALQRSVGATPTRDPASGEMTFNYTTAAGAPHQVWYLDAHSVSQILRIGRTDGLTVGLWRLGREDQRLWSSSTVVG